MRFLDEQFEQIIFLRQVFEQLRVVDGHGGAARERTHQFKVGAREIAGRADFPEQRNRADDFGARNQRHHQHRPHIGLPENRAEALPGHFRPRKNAALPARVDLGGQTGRNRKFRADQPAHAGRGGDDFGLGAFMPDNVRRVSAQERGGFAEDAFQQRFEFQHLRTAAGHVEQRGELFVFAELGFVELRVGRGNAELVAHRGHHLDGFRPERNFPATQQAECAVNFAARFDRHDDKRLEPALSRRRGHRDFHLARRGYATGNTFAPRALVPERDQLFRQADLNVET